MIFILLDNLVIFKPAENLTLIFHFDMVLRNLINGQLNVSIITLLIALDC